MGTAGTGSAAICAGSRHSACRATAAGRTIFIGHVGSAGPSTPESAPQATQPEPATSRRRQPAGNPFEPAAEITEDEVRKLLAGKQLFLRGGYLDNTLSFNEHGVLIGHSPQGSTR